jgi:uncharacterized Zn finger protein (UPF0148 family)
MRKRTIVTTEMAGAPLTTVIEVNCEECGKPLAEGDDGGAIPLLCPECREKAGALERQGD